MRVIFHLSDIHFGRVDRELVEPIVAAAKMRGPDLVVASGDLTQHAFPREFRKARSFLDQLPRPQIVIPGNHDVSLFNPFARFSVPMRRYHKYIDSDPEPFFCDNEIAVLGLNTAHSWTWGRGTLYARHLDIVRERLCPLSNDLAKIVVMHHPIDQPLESGDKSLVRNAQESMETLAKCGADIFLSGHMHVGYTGSTHTRYTISGYSALVIQAGTAISKRGRGEPNSFNVIRIDDDELQVERYWWSEEHATFRIMSTEYFHFTSGVGWRKVEMEAL